MTVAGGQKIAHRYASSHMLYCALGHCLSK